jgi:ABC-type iron transport system FetAB ATPase subunit
MTAQTTPPALRIQGLKSALAGPFDLALGGGDCVGVTGPSGSGKSLFLRMICDLDPNEGEVWLNGTTRGSMSGPAWRRQVVYVPAESGWWDDHILAHFPNDQHDAARAMGARLGLPDDILGGLVSRLSTGERQRMALIRALLMKSPVLLLDEPTSALDGDSAARIEAILAERLAAGMALILVTHNPAQAVRLARQRYIMTAGQLTAAPTTTP